MTCVISTSGLFNADQGARGHDLDALARRLWSDPCQLAVTAAEQLNLPYP
jgi:hypothetical protein